MDAERDTAVEKVRRALGEPVFPEFAETTQKIRRNLMVISFVSLVIGLNDITFAGGSFLGLTFENLDSGVVRTALFWIVLYLLLHFVWNSADYLLHWRLRVTGTKLAHVTGSRYNSEFADYPDDPEQSTLYRWWGDQARAIGNIGRDAKQALDQWEPMLELAKTYLGSDKQHELPNLNNFTNSSTDLSSKLANLARKIEAVEKCLSSQRIPASLERFDKWFRLFSRSQLWRWALIEWLLPVGMGGAALLSICPYYDQLGRLVGS